MYWNKQKIIPQDLTDLQENTLELRKVKHAIWFLFFMVLVIFVYVILDRINIIWNMII